MKKKTKTNYSAEEREARRARILAAKPWLRSTGPKTAEGKARSAQNSLKHGRYTAESLADRSFWNAFNADLDELNQLLETLQSRLPG
jgi:hypothetical protein